jgi:hypothetical protein
MAVFDGKTADDIRSFAETSIHFTLSFGCDAAAFKRFSGDVMPRLKLEAAKGVMSPRRTSSLGAFGSLD